LNVNPNI